MKAVSWPGLSASVGVFALFVGAVHLVTGGFASWTLEAARRARVERAGLRAPAVPLIGRDGAPLVAWGDRSTTPADGRLLIVDFIYTRCPSVCNALGGSFQQMQQRLSDDPAVASRIRLLSLSIDPANDRSADLDDYARRHRADPALWTVAAPVDAQGVDTFRRRWGVVAIPDGAGGFVHNGGIHLIDAGGTVRGIFDPGSWEQALQRARQLSAAPM